MIILYAETNFLLELTLGQEECDSCQQILDWAAASAIILRIPAYSLHEAEIAIRRKQQERTNLRKGIDLQVREFSRMRPLQELIGAFDSTVSALKFASDSENVRYDAVVRDLAACASFVPLTKTAAQDVQRYRALTAVSGEGDLLVFSSVMADILERDAEDVAPRIFVTRNARDFSLVARQMLGKYSCDLFTSYDAAVGRLRTLLA